MRAHFIYEKFTQDSDPIKDMGIGILEKLKKYSIEHLGHHKEPSLSIIKSISKILNLPENEIFLLSSSTHGPSCIFPNNVINEYLKGKLSYRTKCENYDVELKVFYTPGDEGEETNKIIAEGRYTIGNIWGSLDVIQSIGLKHIKKGILYEKFTQDSDPIHDMGIGSLKLIKKWVESVNNNGCHIQDYTIDYRGNINSEGVDISKNEYKVLPKYIRFGEVGFFACNFTKKKHLEQLPKKVTKRLRIFTEAKTMSDLDFSINDILKYCDVDSNNIEIYNYSLNKFRYIKIV